MAVNSNKHFDQLGTPLGDLSALVERVGVSRMRNFLLETELYLYCNCIYTHNVHICPQCNYIGSQNYCICPKYDSTGTKYDCICNQYDCIVLNMMFFPNIIAFFSKIIVLVLSINVYVYTMT